MGLPFNQCIDAFALIQPPIAVQKAMMISISTLTHRQSSSDCVGDHRSFVSRELPWTQEKHHCIAHGPRGSPKAIAIVRSFVRLLSRMTLCFSSDQTFIYFFAVDLFA
jgi:hypothetical protein